MSYQVLARKWRPRTFDDLVGQPHVVRALANALTNDRVHHAFLFTGTRGVGKTTIARILAKCLNCEAGVSARPCGECSACQEIDEGRFVDLIEVDAASRARVDETRDLLDNVQYAPARGRFKVYLIDEVHMFSRHSFNALLKTLEEPPPHVKFLLATTDPQRLPVTVLSRCLQFALRRLPRELIEAQLQRICEAESVPSEEGALRLLSRVADGSMRDGLSLLDQAIAYGGGSLEESDVRAMLGTVSLQHVSALLEALADGDAGRLMEAVDALSDSVPDYGEVLSALAAALTRVALLQSVEAPPGDDLDDEDYRRFAECLSPEAIQLFYQIALIGRRDLPLAPSPRAGFEMIMLRMLAFTPELPEPGGSEPEGAGPGRAASPPAARQRRSPPGHDRPPSPPAAYEAPPAASLSEGGGKPRSGSAEPASPPGPDGDERARATVPEGQVSTAPVSTGPAGALPDSPEAWNALMPSLPLAGMVRELAFNAAFEAAAGEVLRLMVAPGHAALLVEGAQAKIADALTLRVGRTVRVSVSISEHRRSTPADERAMRDEAALAEA